MAAKEKKTVDAPKKDVSRQRSPFPKLSILLGWITLLVGVWHLLHSFSYLSYYNIPTWVVDVLLIVAGFRIIHWGYSRGYYARRKKIFMKYI